MTALVGTRDEHLEVRRQIQATLPGLFTPCPVCPEEGECPQCLGTELVSLATYRVLQDEAEAVVA